MNKQRRSTRLTTALLLLLLGATPALGQVSPHAHEHEHEHAAGLHPDTERIIVTASPLAHTRDELALPVDRLDRQEILNRAGPTIGETIQRVPGVSTTGFSGGASRPVIRGQDAYRTAVLEDSLPTGGVSQLSPDHGVPANPLVADAIEIVRGPATLRYGGGANAGVVNTLTQRIPRTAPKTPFRADLFGAYGSNMDEGLTAAVLEGTQGDFAWHLDGAYQRSEDYDGGNGQRQNGTYYKGGTASVGGAWLGEKTRVGASYTYFSNDYGVPEPGEPVSIDMDANRFRAEFEQSEPWAGIHKIRASGVYTDYEHKEIADGEVGQTFDNDQFDGRVELLHETIGGFDGAIGFTGEYRDFSAGGEAAEYLAPTKSWQFAGYLFEERQLTSALEAQVGLRIEGASVRGTPLDATSKKTRRFVPVSGSVGLLFQPRRNVTLGLTGSVSQRAPGDAELFARGPHEATGTYELGSSSLDPETGYTGELRYEWDQGRIHLSGAAFMTYYEDYIFGNLTGFEVDEDGVLVPDGTPDSLDQLFYISRDALFYGGELSLRADLFEIASGNVRLDGQFDWVRARFHHVGPGVNSNVPRVTPIRWGGGLSFDADNLRARIGFIRSQRQKHTGEFEPTTGAYTLLNMNLTWQLATVVEGADVELMIAGENLTDEVARNPIAINKEDVLLRGRAIRTALRVRF
jgi:iron complex outermembrane receptor protein